MHARPHALRPSLGLALRLVAAACCLTLAACAGPHAGGLPDRRPPDFALGLTVYTPEGPVRRPGQRAARYIVDADGWLRAAVGPGAESDLYPMLARRLTAPQRDELWSLIRAAGFASVSEPLRIAGPENFDPPSGRRVYLVELTAARDRSGVAMPEGEPETEPFIDLADRLATWAWVEP
jgi:hypothetical protein